MGQSIVMSRRWSHCNLAVLWQASHSSRFYATRGEGSHYSSLELEFPRTLIFPNVLVEQTEILKFRYAAVPCVVCWREMGVELLGSTMCGVQWGWCCREMGVELLGAPCVI